VATGEEGILAVLSLVLADSVFEWLLPGQLLVLATALLSLVLRLRRTSGEERQQVKWFVYTVVTRVLVFVTTTLPSAPATCSRCSA
jgi:hypothetical protein